MKDSNRIKFDGGRKAPPGPRKVKVVRVCDCWTVLYVERKKGQYRSAAQFACSMWSLGRVENWVRENPKLELVPCQ